MKQANKWFKSMESLKKTSTAHSNHSRLLVLTLALVISFIGCSSPKLIQKQPSIPNGGRAVAIATNPVDDKKVIVASETGGLFFTWNGGNNWRHVSRVTTFGFRDVMYHPTDPNIVIAAANSDTRFMSGGGIYRSTNGGENWSKATMNAPNANCANSMAAHCLSFDPSNGRLWAGTNCGLFYSDDKGANWNFLYGTTGLGTGSIYAILTPATNRMVALTDNSVVVSIDGGNNWTLSTNGLPGGRSAQQHNQIVVSPQNNQHIYFAFHISIYDSGTDTWTLNNALYYSRDFGSSWNQIVNQNGINRPPFVALSKSALGGGRNKVDMYYSDGACQLRRREIVHGTIPTFNQWNNINSDHCDAADIGFSMDGKTPILLASDGGVHKTSDNGATWTMTGGGKGFSALQITEVTGQTPDMDDKENLYFGTQDNEIWASPDYGTTWPNRRCCEGFYLTVPRVSVVSSITTHTGVSCAPCGNYKSKSVLIDQNSWNNPPREDGSPALIGRMRYAQVQFATNLTDRFLARTIDNGASWTSKVPVNKEIMNLPLVVGSSDNPIIYLATDESGLTSGAPNIGLRRVAGLLDATYVQTELTGFGNIGIFPTMFAWYEVFGVKPSDPNFIIVPDIANDVVKKSMNGGVTWVSDNNLTSLVTNSGEFKFHWGRFSQISCFGFDPECINHIMVGTQQAGIFQSFDNGNTWEKVPHSENIPFVSSFFFRKEGEVVISSYGRGLWRFQYKCLPSVILPPIDEHDQPVLWFKKQLTPLGDIIIDENCTGCGFFLLEGGNINDVVIDTLSGKVEEIFIDNGVFRGYSHYKQEMEIPVTVSQGKGGNGIITADKELAKLLKGTASVKGIYLNDNLYNGVIVHNADINSKDLPEIKQPLPSVSLNVRSDLGIPIDEIKNVIIIGRGFNSQFPIEVIVDGETQKLEERLRFDENGNFQLPVPPILGIGNHTVLFRQETDKGLIEDMVDIRIVVQDFPEEKQ